MLLDLAEKMGIKIGKIYREIVSGETIEARPEIQKLLCDVKKGMWKGVLVVEVERLARGETMDQGIVAKAFKISDTKIITPMKTYDPNDEFDEEYFEFGLFMSRREYKTINRRLQRGRVSSVNEGKYVGSVAPYGYERVKIKGDKGYTLRKNSESNTVKIIYDLYAYEDLSLHEVVRRINEMGLKPRKNDKWSVLRQIRQTSKVPIIMLTARGEEQDELFGFELGVDEYISKPFSPKILVARVEALLKRTRAEENGTKDYGGIIIDSKGRTVTVDGKQIEMSLREYELLKYLVDNKGIALSRDKILNNVWNYDYYGDSRTIDSHIKKIRHKLGKKGKYIQTIRGIGYKFEVK